MTSSSKKIKAKSIGHYILGKTIGEGTFGKVKLGTHILTGEKVAVKILEKERIVDVADVERVAREIHILKLIQHPHVIQLFEIIETPKQLYLIMEFCSGGELFDHIVANGRIQEREACRFFHQIISGVEQIHQMSVVHRDLKPENLLLDDHKNIKIVDFGLSNTFHDGQLLKTACGSPCYAAPEMVAGQLYVPSRCDLWSCGVILFALVCGYLPFEDQNTSALYRKILNAEYTSPKFISELVQNIINKLLTTDPDKRATVQCIRQHAWYRQIPEASIVWDRECGERVLDEDVLVQLDRFGFPREYAVKCLQMSKHNHVTTTYYLLLEKRRKLKDQSGGQSQEPLCGAEFDNHAPIGASQESHSCDSQVHELEESGHTAHNTDTSILVGKDTSRSDIMLHLPADADRAGGGSPSARGSKSPKGAENRSTKTAGQPSTPAATTRDLCSFISSPSRSSSTCANGPTSGSARQGSSGNIPNSTRVGGVPRRHNSNHSVPQSPPSTAEPTPRKRVPAQQASGYATPRGPVSPPVAPAMTSSKNGSGGGNVDGSSCRRTFTPSPRHPSHGLHEISPRSSGGVHPSSSSRAGTSQGTATPSCPAGPVSGRNNLGSEARRRFANDGAPGSARSARTSMGVAGTSAGVGIGGSSSSSAGGGSGGGGGGGGGGWIGHGSGGGSTRGYSSCGDGVGGGCGGGGSKGGGGGGGGGERGGADGNTRHGFGASPSRANASGIRTGTAQTRGRSTGSPSSGRAVWPSASGTGGGSARALSATPEVTGHVSSNASNSHAGKNVQPMSARDARETIDVHENRDDSMRSCRGIFNVSCTSSKPPKQIMSEIQHSLTSQRILFKQASPFLVRCQRQSLRFEMEISHLDQLQSMYVVRFKRTAGDLVTYKDLCSKILSEMRI